MYYHKTWWSTCQLLLRTLEAQIEHYSAEIWSEGQYASIRGEPLFEDSKILCSGVKFEGVDAPQLKMMHASRPNIVGEIVLDSKPKRKRSRKRGSKKVSEPATISVARVANRGELTAAPVALTAPKRRRKKKSTYNTFEPMHSASALGLPHAVAQAAEGALCPDTATQFFPAPAFTASKHLATFKQTSFINKLENYAAGANQLRAFVIMDPRPDSGMLLTKQTSLNEVFLPRTGDVASLDNRLHFELNNAQKSWGLARDKKKAAEGALLSFVPRACNFIDATGNATGAATMVLHNWAFKTKNNASDTVALVFRSTDLFADVSVTTSTVDSSTMTIQSSITTQLVAGGITTINTALS